MGFETPWDVAERAAAVLAPETNLFEDTDVAQFGRALALAVRGAATHGASTAEAVLGFASDVARVPLVALGRSVGADLAPPVDVDPKDRRFADPAWTSNPFFYALRLSYLATSRLAERFVAAANLEPGADAKARMAAALILDALAPTNFLPTNPAALKRAFETGGGSLVKGANNFVYDLLHNKGRPRQVDTRPFVKGKNVAATPCKVVYRNELMELLQYEPQTPQVHATPLLCSPPWINKYYVMDLAPGRSFIEWAIKHNRTVFAISYRNPSAEMSNVTMDDYLIHGPQKALDVITDITDAEKVDIVGLCLGGALTAITAAYLSASGDTRVGNLTLLNTLLDYSNPGALGMFTDEAAVTRLEKKMAKKGQLEGEAMAGTFDVLRSNDLIFNYVISNWLMGQDPPAFDILAWNSDSTRMPAAMHSFYLRNFYVKNLLARGDLEIAGQKINLGAIKQPTYIVGAENDHIMLWQSAYASTGLVSGPVRYVLSSGGHIAGIVNPPSPKGWYLVADSHPAMAPEWRAIATKNPGSWWEDWAQWSGDHAGDLVDPPPIGSDNHPVLYDGPGEYIDT
jgi:polyhydroxyalkanoate synthase